MVSRPGENGGDGACDHAADAKQQQHRLGAGGGEHVDTDDLVDDLDEKHDIPLGHHAGQDARGGRGGLAVGIRHPQVEGEQAAFDGQARRHQAQGHGHGEPVPAGGPQLRDGGVQLGEQQVAGDGIGEDDADQEQAGAHQGEDHIAGGGDQGAPAPAHRQQGAGGDGQHLDEHIAGENVVGVAQGHQRHMGQVHHDPIELLLVGGDVLQDAAHTAQHAQQHDPGKQHGQEGLQNTRRQLVAPGGGVVAHHIIVADVVHRAVYQHRALEHHAGRQQENAQPPGPAGVGGKGHHGAHQGQNDGEEGEILHKAHCSPSSFCRFLWDIIIYSLSMSRVR